MQRQEVKCPYCGSQIDSQNEKCSNCGEFFVEPNLSEFKLVSIPLYIAGESVLSAFGLPLFYSMIWIMLNYKNICNLAIQKDLRKFNILFLWFTIFVLLIAVLKFSFIFGYVVNIQSATNLIFGFTFLKFFVLIAVILDIFLAYRILRIIEKFTLRKYGSPVTHHEVGMIVFRTLYVIYYLDTYLIRVKDPAMRYCLNIDKSFKYFIFWAVILVLLYFLGLLSIPIIKF